MSSSPDPLLLLELQGSGEHPDTWGDNLNATIALIGQAVAGSAPIVTTGGTTTLTDTQYAANQARCSALDFSGVLVSNATIVVPTRTKSWIVRNQCTGAFTLTVKTSAGTGVVVSQGQVAILWCDGTNVVSVSTDASTLGGYAASAYARLAASSVFTAGFGQSFHDLVDGGTITADVSIGSVFGVTLGGNRTLAVSNAADGLELELYVTQDGTGGRTLTLPANFVGAGSTLSSGANAVDRLQARYKGALGVWYYTITRGINSGGSSTISDVTISGSANNVDVFALAGSPSGAVSFTFTLDEGVTVGSLVPASPALDFDGFAAGSTIALVIRGLVQGAGGNGGAGGMVTDADGGANVIMPGRHGEDGGDAIRLPSSSGNTITVNITSTGRVWGGGGGGGGGGATADVSGSAGAGAGGGGGGGAGGGRGGPAASAGSTSASAVCATNGASGTVGRVGTAGAGGAGAQSTNATGGAGGAGGTPGTSGSNGVAPTSSDTDAAAGNGGAAGKAINYNGGSTPTQVGNTGSPYILGATS